MFCRKGSLKDEFHTKKEVLGNTAGSERRLEKLKRVHGWLDTRAQGRHTTVRPSGFCDFIIFRDLL